ncbi:MAG: GAF domain-containing sensor histidine kinase [Deltaproteobacteria bacterium]|nr:GAF domain-containing sensor histidine kinase [Deltaproteobacteria bacterium]
MEQLVLDTAPEIADVLGALGGVSGMPTILLTHVQADTWRILSSIGGGELGLHADASQPLRRAFCDQVCRTGEPLVVADAEHDERFREHGAHRELGITSYIGVPFRIGGGPVLGTLCAVDRRPHIGLDRVVPHFELMGRLLSHELRWAEEARTSLAALQHETEVAVSRERFLATVAHDLRTPLAAIRMSAHLVLRQSHVVDRVVSGIGRVLHAADRMARLIDDLLDFARGRLGGGIPIARQEIGDVRAFLRALLEETAMAFPWRPIKWDLGIAGHEPASWDRDRVAQCLENLLGNACEHGDDASPVTVAVSSDSGEFRVEIVNAGEFPVGRISTFDPFAARSGRRGLGLGLFIADRIARAHGGSIAIESARGQTSTVLTLPSGVPVQRGSAA